MTTITPAEFEKAVRLACMQRAVRDADQPMMLAFTFGDESAVRYGPFLVDIAKLANVTIPMARRRMKVLQDDARVLRDDAAGGRTRWWLAGLSAELRPVAPVAAQPAPVRQTLTPQAAPAREPWWKVLGVARDCSTSEVRLAFKDCMEGVPEYDLDAEQQRQRIRDAYNARLTEDGISEYE